MGKKGKHSRMYGMKEIFDAIIPFGKRGIGFNAVTGIVSGKFTIRFCIAKLVKTGYWGEGEWGSNRWRYFDIGLWKKTPSPIQIIQGIPRFVSRENGEMRATAIAVDFDGCLFENKWLEIGEPNKELIETLRDFRSRGGELILWTNREGETLERAVEACRNEGLEFDAVNANLESWKAVFNNDTRKVGADYYIDDKAICAKYGEGTE